jgi:hypothetical protein
MTPHAIAAGVIRRCCKPAKWRVDFITAEYLSQRRRSISYDVWSSPSGSNRSGAVAAAHRGQRQHAGAETGQAG